MEAQQQCSGMKVELGNEAGWLDDLPRDFDAYSCNKAAYLCIEKQTKGMIKKNEKKVFFCLW